MSEPFLAEVRMYGFNFPPRGWAQCDGQILPINQYQSLYSLLGTTYGGDGRTSFALPDLRGRTPLHEGSNGGASHPLGQKSGEETHTLSLAELPNHSHVYRATSDAASQTTPSNAHLASAGGGRRPVVPYGSGVQAAMRETGASGGGNAHNNMQPFLAINFCIALQGLFPSRN